jgi:choline transport protein
VFQYFVIVGTNTAASRLAWSMARDFAFPFPEWFANVSPRFGIPVRALTGVLVIDLILGLIVLGSNYAFQAIVSCGGVCIQVGYVIPIIVLLIRGRKILPPHPNFDLGRFGLFINIVSISWSLLIITMMFFPMYVPIDLTSLGE